METPDSSRVDWPSALPLPVAVARLAAAHAAVDEASLVAEYGSRPGPTALRDLAGQHGAVIGFRKIAVSRIDEFNLPLAIVGNGGALLLQSIEGNRWVLEGAEGKKHVDAELFSAGKRLTIITGGQMSSDTTPAPDAVPIAATEQKSLLRYLFSHLWSTSRRELLLLGIAAALSNLALVALPIFIMSVYDRVIPHSAFESLQTLALGITIALAFDLGLRFSRLKFVDAIGLKLSAALNTAIYRQLLRVKSTQRPNSAAALTSAQNDLEGLAVLCPEFLIGVTVDLGFTALVLLAIFLIGGPVVLGPIVGMGAVAATVYFSARALTKASSEAAAIRHAATAQMTETYDCLSTVKATGASSQLLSRYEKLQGILALKSHDARHRLRFAASAVQVIIQLTIVATLCLGVMRIDAGAMSIGSLAAITMLVGRGVGPVAQTTDQILRLRALSSLTESAFSILKETEAEGGEADGGASKPFAGTFSIRDVTVQYEEDAPLALDRLSLDFAPGSKIGLVGKNGSGKSTLMALLPRLVVPQSGSIQIDGSDARQFSAATLRQKMAFAPQESVLFNTTLRDNICLGREQVDEEAFKRACAAAGVDRIAGNHPKGYSLLVGPRGEHLSGGERQAVALARTLLTDKPILILDEPTAQMDHTLEGHVIQQLAEWTKTKTLIVSTHRLRLLSLVTRVIALDQGRIIADGPRDQVLASLGGNPNTPTKLNRNVQAA